MQKITEKKDLVPGQLYCCFTIDENGYEADGSLVWYGADEKFYDANYADTEGEIVHPDYDFLVPQVGAFNPDYAAA